MKYFAYQVAKYFLILLVTVILVLYLAKNDKLPRFLSDEVRNYLVDLSDTILSYDIFSKVYTPFSAVFDFLADDGYHYKYETLPDTILKRLDGFVFSIDNDINLFTNNPVFESWIIQSIIKGKSQVLDEVISNYFNYPYLIGVGIYSARGIEITYYGKNIPSEIVNYTINSRKKLVLNGPYFARIKELKKDVDFIDGYLIVFLDSKLFFKEVFNSELKDFKNIYILDPYTNILYSMLDINDTIKDNAFNSTMNIYGEVFNNKVVPYKNLFYVGFTYPKPNFLRVINIAFRIILVVGILILLVWLNLKIKSELTKINKREEMLLKQLKSGLKQLPYKSIKEKKDINNLYVTSTEQSLKYFENFVKNDKETSNENYITHHLLH